MKKFVFYDLDGTIVDTRLDIANAGQHMVRSLKGKEISREDVYLCVGRGIRQLIEGCLQSSDEKSYEEGFRIYRDHYKEHLLDNTELYPDARSLIERYKDAKQAVITNKPEPFSTRILEALGVSPYFCAIVAGSGSEYPKKPDPSAVLALLEKEGVSKEEALFIGDSQVDFETGKNAGIDVILLSHGFSKEETLSKLKPEYLVPDIGSLLKLLDQKGW